MARGEEWKLRHLIGAKEKQATAQQAFVFLAPSTSKRPMESDREREERVCESDTKKSETSAGRAEVSDFFCIFCNFKNILVNLQNFEKEARFSCTR